MKSKWLLTLIITCIFNISAWADTPKVQEITTKKHLTAWVIEDHYLPIVSLNLTFQRAGFAYDADDKSGLAYMVSGLLDEGVEGMTSLQYRKKLEELASSIDFDVDEDNFYISVNSLKENFEETLKIVNLVLTKPTFDLEAVDRIRNQLFTILDKKAEDPNYIAAQEFKKVIFKNHPYNHTQYGTKETLEHITREDLVGFIQNHFNKQYMKISVAGDVQTKELSALLDQYLGNIPDQPSKQTTPLTTPEINTENKIIYINKPIPQSIIVFGNKGTLRSDPDFYPAYLANHILGGGGFESRLTNEVREKNGLAYSIYSYLDLKQQAGLFVGMVGTKNENVDKVIGLIKSEIAKIKNHGVTQSELRDAQDYLVYSFPLRMTKNSKLASFLSGMQNYNLGIDFLEKRNHYIRDISIEEANKAAYEFFVDPDHMVFVVVGDRTSK